MHTEMTRYLAVLLTTLVFFGCAHVTREGIMQRVSEKASSFEEINEKDNQLPEGYSELVIKASIKIPQKEFYLIKTRPPRDENSQYPFVLDINGQGVLWMVNCILDEQRIHICSKRNPEGGEGLICRLEKRIRLRSGSYKVYLGLPEEEFETEVSISLTDGSSNVLEFKPIYWRSGDKRRTFWSGISDFDIFFNGRPYRTHLIHKGGRSDF
ncbi:MAG: hypothetical protein ABSB22_21520 [Thermodesulfobacteriota bacterium]|jgi:hypothetical protein